MIVIASPPGAPDAIDLAKLEGWQPLDLEALQQRQLYLASRYRVAFLFWAYAVAFCILAMVFTGALVFFIAGYAVTLPFLYVGSKYKRAIANAVEFQAMCDLNDWCE